MHSFLTLCCCLYDLIGLSEADIEQLANVVNQKTQGNPYFINQFLLTLFREKHIQFITGDVSSLQANSGSGSIGVGQNRWVCRMGAIHAENYTSNVVDMMVRVLGKFSSGTQWVLGAAATIGNQFDLDLLSRVCQKPVHEMSRLLSDAIKYVIFLLSFALSFVFCFVFCFLFYVFCFMFFVLCFLFYFFFFFCLFVLFFPISGVHLLTNQLSLEKGL
jgi:predicted ATPase